MTALAQLPAPTSTEQRLHYFHDLKPRPGRVPALADNRVPHWLGDLLPGMLAELAEPFVKLDADLYQQMVDGLWEGDAPMDRVVEWMFSGGSGMTPGQAKKRFDQALDQGIDSLDNPPPVLTDFFRHIDTLPDWVDMALVDEGAAVCNLVGGAGAEYMRDIALMGGYVFAGLNPPLVMTGALKSSASKRFAETFAYGVDTWTVGGMHRFGVGFKSAIRIRMIHALVRRNLQRKEEWDFAQWGIPVNQTDMLSSYLGPATFAWGALVQGVPITAKEEKAVIHHAALAGWLLGVKDEWIVHDRVGVVRMMLHSLATQPLGDDYSKQMARSLAEEPLHRHYPKLASLRRRFAHHRHLSISSFYLPKKVRDGIGLKGVFPWYPLLSIPARLGWHLAHRAIPGGRQRLMRIGEAKQHRQAAIFADYSRQASALVDTDSSHPAHLG